MGMSSPPSSLWPRLALTWLIYTVTGVASVYFAAANDFVSPLYLAAGLGRTRRWPGFVRSCTR